MKVLQGDGFGTDMSVAKGVVFITLDGGDVCALVVDLDATHGFTEVAGTSMNLYIHRYVSLCWVMIA